MAPRITGPINRAADKQRGGALRLSGVRGASLLKKADFIVIGSGIAGVRAAIELAPHGRVVVITKSKPDESNTEYAQGGIAVALNDEDEIGLHYQDTISAGDGLCDEAAVSTLVTEGPERIQELIDWGAEFDREGSKLAFTREAAHSRKRILHAQGDSTGQEINRTLIRKVRSLPNAALLPHCFALQLLTDESGCQGVRYLERASGQVKDLRAAAVILATGGVGMLFRDTTNPDVATGDGCALALRAGAVLADMEFIQFHPTALKMKGAPRFLLSEALRGEGARLVTASGERFMERYHPLGDLAPRDVVSRSIFLETRARGEQCAYLDMTHLGLSFVRRRFPRIYSTCKKFGLDIAREKAPVFPAAHYHMGGVWTDLNGRTTVPGLLAAGEAACTGVHGANRLASNSLLEGLVFGCRAARALLKSPGEFRPPLTASLKEFSWPDGNAQAADRDIVRTEMTERVGIVRDGDGLRTAANRFLALTFSRETTQAAHELNNLLTNARVTSLGALLRKESRGGHHRSDYPKRDDLRWKKRLTAVLNPAQTRLLFCMHPPSRSQ